MRLKHLKGNIYAIKGKPVRLTHGVPGITANSLFIDDHKKAVIDPAADSKALKKLSQMHAVDYCFLTHAHLDHVSSLSYFPEAKVHIHHAEKANWDGILYNLLYSKHIVFCLAEIWKNKLLSFKVDKRFADKDTFQIGDTTLQVIHAPGHTGGHCVFYFPNERILYSGDYDLSAMGPSYSYADSNIDDMLATTRKILGVPVDIWVSGHWRYVVTKNIAQKVRHFDAHIQKRDSRILAALKTPRFQCSLSGNNTILPESIIKNSWLMQAMEKKMIALHLARLQQQGKVRKLFWGGWVSV